jgi:hypothetical protein
MAWPGYIATNSVASIAVAPALGGRMIGFKLGGTQLLYSDPAWYGKTVEAVPGGNSFWQHASFGGMRFMPSPQAFWKVQGAPIPAWPPPPAIDYGLYAASIGGDAIFTHGPVENNALYACVGMQLRYRWRLVPGAARVQVEAFLTNFSHHRQLWGLWDIAQMVIVRDAASPAEVFWPMRSHSESRFGSDEYLNQQGRRADGQVVGDVARRQVVVRDLGIGRKVSGDSDGGWLALWRPDAGIVVVKTFTYEAEAWARMTYPEGGSTVAVAVLAGRSVVELESMTPVVDLDPGESVKSSQEMAACRVAARPLSIHSWGVVVTPPAQADGRLRASLGVFDAGELIVTAADGAKQRMKVSPLEPVTLDVSWPGGPVAFSLLKDSAATAVPLDLGNGG